MFEQIIKEAEKITTVDEKIDFVMDFYRNDNSSKNRRQVRDWLHTAKLVYKEEREKFVAAIDILDSYQRGR